MASERDMAWHRRAERLAASRPEIITAGFPCQDISYAGKGAGLAGTRSGLVWSLLRTIRLVRPRRALLENVSALLSRGLGEILGHMATVGYDAEWHCIPASAVGAPHRRDRIWIIATDAVSYKHEGDRAPISGQIAEELSRATANAEAMLGPEVVGSEPDGDSARVAEMADAASLGFGQGRARRSDPGREGQQQPALQAMGNAFREAQPQPEGREPEEWRWPSNSGWWSAEPAVGRVADGVPHRVDRLRGLGNAVVPQIPEIIGCAILKAERVKP